MPISECCKCKDKSCIYTFLCDYEYRDKLTTRVTIFLYSGFFIIEYKSNTCQLW